MRRRMIVCTLAAMSLSLVGTAVVAQGGDKRAASLHTAYQEILKTADKDKDGKLSVDECTSIFKDPAKAKKDCTYWDANKDGIITEEEYVQQGLKLMK
jgi:hypothetical protein